MSEHTSHHSEKAPVQDPLFELPKENEGLFERFDYDILSDPELRHRYVRYTEKLIAKTITEEQDVLIFLDKSARPVSWLMRSLWPTLGVKGFDDEGNPIPAPMPEMKYANIDREQWAPLMGRSEVSSGRITLDNVPPDTIDSLTGLYAVKAFDMLMPISKDEPTMLDDQNVLIVDEVKSSGDTVVMAELLFKKAFKNAKSITSTYWMTPETKYDKKSGGMINAETPIWYDKNQIMGRLVGNRDFTRSSNSDSIRQRRGAQFLSYPFRDNKGKTIVDKSGVKLRKEMYQLGKEVANGLMPVMENAQYRPDDDRFHEMFMHHVNGLSDQEFKALRDQANKDKKQSLPEIVAQYKRDRALHELSEN